MKEVDVELIEAESNVIRFQIREDLLNSLRNEHMLIERSDLVIDEIIGKGNFGLVYKGILSSDEGSVEVAVKALYGCEY